MLDPRIATGGATLIRPNAIGSTLGLLGDEWTLLIVRGAFEGARRYGDWKAALPISDAVLTARLRTLVEAGVLQPGVDAAGRSDYRLTESGLDLWRLLLSIWHWEQQHVAHHAGALPSMVHSPCGAEFGPQLRCAGCHRPVDATEVDASFPAAGGFERSAPVGGNRRRAATGRSGHAGPGLFADTMTVIGSRWSSAVLGAAFLGATRFRDFEQIGAPPSVLSERLRTFVDVGVLTPADDATGEYRLTAKGSALFPVVVAFLQWGETWRPAPDGPAVVATHRTCGRPFVPEWCCDRCHDELRRQAVRVVTHPAAARV